MRRETRILFSLEVLSSGLEAHCREKSVQIVGDRLIEAVKLTNVCAGRGCDCQEAKIRREGSVDAREQLQVVGDGTRLSSGLETYCREKSAQIVGDTLIEAVKSTAFVRGEVAITGERLEETGGERSIDALE
jgi:hypothetical protein